MDLRQTLVDAELVTKASLKVYDDLTTGNVSMREAFQLALLALIAKRLTDVNDGLYDVARALERLEGR